MKGQQIVVYLCNELSVSNKKKGIANKAKYGRISKTC